MRKYRFVLGLWLLFVLAGCNITVNSISSATASTTMTFLPTTTASTTTTETTPTTTIVTTAGTTIIATTATTATTLLYADKNNTSPYDETYYMDAIGLTGDALKTELHIIIKDHKEYSYTTQLWSILAVTDKDPNNPNNVIEIYTGKSISNQDHGGNAGEWNREHVWPQSHGDIGTAPGPGTDLFNLHPSDVQTNAARGNLDFDDGGNESVINCPLCTMDTDSFDPTPSMRGDIARSMFYMAVCYDLDNNPADLELNDLVNNGSNPYLGKISTLLEWNEEDPVDAFEMNRNNVIYTDYQHNRNPFIDHPEWAELIWGNRNQ